MAQTAGRPISPRCTCCSPSSGSSRCRATQRLAALLARQPQVPEPGLEQLAEQVLDALYELLRGFQAAHDASKGRAAARGRSPRSPTRSTAGSSPCPAPRLPALRRGAGCCPRTRPSCALLGRGPLRAAARGRGALPRHHGPALRRLGAAPRALPPDPRRRRAHGDCACPPRHGDLFDPDRFPFLEGRAAGGARQIARADRAAARPRRRVYRVLENLLVLDGERISYRALDVEQIGSVYEAMMGFRSRRRPAARSRSSSQKKQGAPTAVDLDALLAEPALEPREVGRGARRSQAHRHREEGRRRRRRRSRTCTRRSLPVIDQAATPDLVPQGAMVLQPSEERRRSGSHYTPRSLTEPIVRTTLEPILERLRGADGRPPRPEQILDLKVCDPAMGSGAFLVEACRYLGDALVEAWHAHGARPAIPPDEDEVLFARRLVAQRCLYGVDRNPLAVDLAKLSLWLATLAKDHPFTFLDHALRHGDSLVGLSRDRSRRSTGRPMRRASRRASRRCARASTWRRSSELRRKIREADESVSDCGAARPVGRGAARAEQGAAPRRPGRRGVLRGGEGEGAGGEARGVREARVVSGEAERYRGWLEELPRTPTRRSRRSTGRSSSRRCSSGRIRGSMRSWGIRRSGGQELVDAATSTGYPDWLDGAPRGEPRQRRPRRALLPPRLRPAARGRRLRPDRHEHDRPGRHARNGLRWICTHGGDDLRRAQARQVARHGGGGGERRPRREGRASRDRSVSTTARSRRSPRSCSTAAATTIRRGSRRTRARASRAASSSAWASPSTTPTRRASPRRSPRCERLIAKDPRNAERDLPLHRRRGGEHSPTHAHHRYVINFGEMSEEECRRRWPDLMAIVEAKVKPERMRRTTATVRAQMLVAVRRDSAPSSTPPSRGWSGCW